MLTCTPQYDNNTTVGSAHGRYNAHKTWLIVNTIFTYSYYERLHTDYLDKRNLPKLIIRLVLSILPHAPLNLSEPRKIQHNIDNTYNAHQEFPHPPEPNSERQSWLSPSNSN